MRVVFMGTPDFAVPTLERLVADGFEVNLVVTQPDRPAGRGRHLLAPPVKQAAVRHGLSVIQPRRLREAEVLAALAAARPEAIVVAAFGQILPRAVLDIPRLGCLNVHASLLPRWRGAAPIAAAILHGDPASGVSIMLMEAGLDTGPVLAQAREEISVTDTSASLGERLSLLGANLLSRTLPVWARGEVQAEAQDDAQATYAPQLRKEDGRLDWSAPAEAVWRRVRAFNPWPAAFTYWQGRLLRILQGAPLGGASGIPGATALLSAAEARARAPYPALLPSSGRVLACATGEGTLALLRVQLEGGKPVAGSELAAGYRGLVGARLGGGA